MPVDSKNGQHTHEVFAQRTFGVAIAHDSRKLDLTCSIDNILRRQETEKRQRIRKIDRYQMNNATRRRCYTQASVSAAENFGIFLFTAYMLEQM